ncbi:hypothetical protein [Psychromonas sp. KJ10-2]|uniref:hypothetical protein n=1 Tax=Psychromonas sp. KJ10-2 TaxID=3391822 RepID=UPI0039B57EBA
MDKTHLNGLEKQLVNTSALSKGIIFFVLGSVVTLILNQLFLFSLPPAFILLFLLSLFVMWQDYCQQKQLLVLQSYLKDPESAQPEQLKGNFSQLYFCASSS